eukprot:gnl/TRDRNA2_/TRDRNA2_122020_c0_seq1.p1 gnl/TRDRNA2_/TRDRNA2_122020_c0~~gnl/TRDRNA2_/TRDRNA2_122020_c0_seq1.p1  ORF type:complete len:354 (-),score=71.63 gnl/TRDRNA2_/TRDRNA2_122020_c0_seq1:52-966(-)
MTQDADASQFGFIIVDGNGALFGLLKGSRREALSKISVDLPKKHGRGGQSALRFARLRTEKRANYLRKVSEIATKTFISQDKPNIAGLVVGGSADFKTELVQSNVFDQRLEKIIVAAVDLSYGGEPGFSQAIELASESLSNVKLVSEQRVISRLLNEIAKDTGKFCFGAQDTLEALENGAVETLIMWEDLQLRRIILRDATADSERVSYVTPEEAARESFYRDPETGAELTKVSDVKLSDWINKVYQQCGANLELVTDHSEEGKQFCKGLTGIGGLLRYELCLERSGVVFGVDEEEWNSGHNIW